MTYWASSIFIPSDIQAAEPLGTPCETSLWASNICCFSRPRAVRWPDQSMFVHQMLDKANLDLSGPRKHSWLERRQFGMQEPPSPFSPNHEEPSCQPLLWEFQNPFYFPEVLSRPWCISSIMLKLIKLSWANGNSGKEVTYPFGQVFSSWSRSCGHLGFHTDVLLS